MRSLLSGTDAIIHVLLEQRRRDAAAGLKTAGFISGYRGSPLGTLDMALWARAEELRTADVHFNPGVNEELAATSVWGSQYIGQVPGAPAGGRVDGVFSVWYGKGPGVDRSGDALKHGNLAGASPLGGALVLAGDDHAAKSSTTAHQSDQALVAAGIPVLYPSDAEDILHLGLHGLAMSRVSGCWVAMKLVTDVMETSSSTDLGAQGPQRAGLVGNHGTTSRIPDPPKTAEERLIKTKLPAVLRYAREQGLNRFTHDCRRASHGLLTAGKSHADVIEALRLLGLTAPEMDCLGLRILKLDLVWPLDPEGIASFAEDLQDILVVEEKRPFVEDQLKAVLYDLPSSGTRPRIIGKQESALPAWGELNPVQIASAISDWLQLGWQAPALEAADAGAAQRLPSFCSGCPHGTSTRVPEGSRALAGIGCHGMATIRQPGVTTTMSQMGGEGAMWIGQAPFTNEAHVFANVGDGTWFHSGILALRAAVAAKVNITYKILFNGFVSMTGGQPIDGTLTVPGLLQSLQAEGVGRVALVSDEPDKYASQTLPGQPSVHHRRDLEQVQKTMRELPGVTAIVYEQPCATERRRLRKRGQWADPAVRTFIHPAVCEGCGDCGKASDCLSIEPLETPWGRKRQVNQSSCNKDRSCVEGFCPSFVTVHGGRFKGSVAAEPAAPSMPEEAVPLPQLPECPEGWNVLFAGVGGTGVVSASTVLAKAAHEDGWQVGTLDVTGLSQKYGGVQSHVRLMKVGSAKAATRIPVATADLLIGCDLLVSAEHDVVTRLKPASSVRGVLNTAVSPSADFTRQPDWNPGAEGVRQGVLGRLAHSAALDATALSERLTGDSIGANLILLGMAWQAGWVPVSLGAIQKAIGAKAHSQQRAFEIGRRAAHRPDWAASVLSPPAQPITLVPRQPHTLAAWLALHADHLTAYQGDALAALHRQRVQRLVDAGADDALSIAVARSLVKLMAPKDEFEVARLLSAPSFAAQLKTQFEGEVSLHFHLGGGPLERKDASGKHRKTEIGPWVMPFLALLGRLRGVRGTWLDPWRRSPERRLSGQWQAYFEDDLALIERALQAGQSAQPALRRLAELPQRLRGYGHVREANGQTLAPQRDAYRREILELIQEEHAA